MDEWVKKSHKLPGIKDCPWLAFDFQSLGALNELIEVMWNESNTQTSGSTEEIVGKSHAFILLRAWLLATYEVVRVLKEKDNKFAPVYKKLRRVRVPIAKYEPVKNRGAVVYPNDLTPPLLAVANDKLGWAFNENEYISKDDLIKELLDTV